MPALYGLIGYPLKTSFSPAYFAEKFAREHIDASYRLFPMADVAALPALLLEYPKLRGLNVTIPHKTAVIPLLHDLSEEAAAIGAVNCIAIRNGHTRGFNTDAGAFGDSLTPLLAPHHKKALILGTGGASKAVSYVLDQLGIPYRYVSRTPAEGHLTYAALSADIVRDHPLLINTTPLGMSPDTGFCPAIPYEGIGRDHLLYDLIYTPAETLFLTMGKERGAGIKNGLEMLHLQAEAAWHIWQQ